MQGIVAALVALAAAMPPPPPWGPAPSGPDDRELLVQGNSRFAVELFRQFQNQPGNLFLSPYSISSALAMTYGGARGVTANEMARVLHFDLPPGRLHPAFSGLARSLVPEGQGQPPYQLRIANALWGHRAGRFQPEFLKLTRDHYGAGFYGLDFSNPEPARQTINNWVARQTENKIQNLLGPGHITPLTRLVLTNAIFFKGRWDSPFSKEDTRPGNFHLVNGQTIQTPLMFQKDRCGYAEAPGLQILTLPYAGKHFSMVVLLPRREVGLARLEQTLTPEVLAGWLNQVGWQEVHVTLPCFKMESSFELAGVLAALGLRTLFGPQADLSGMGGVPGEPPLFVSAVVHKAFVEVNEGGTEAAAATAVPLCFGAAPGMTVPDPVPEFLADRPFLFLICDVRSGSVLFLGRMTDPR